MPKAWKVRRGHLVIGSFVCLSVCQSNSVLLTNSTISKVWVLIRNSNQTWTVTSSMGSSHFTDITCPWGWGRVKMYDFEIFAIFWLCCGWGHPCFTNTCLVVIKVNFLGFLSLVYFKNCGHFTMDAIIFSTWHYILNTSLPSATSKETFLWCQRSRAPLRADLRVIQLSEIK